MNNVKMLKKKKQLDLCYFKNSNKQKKIFLIYLKELIDKHSQQNVMLCLFDWLLGVVLILNNGFMPLTRYTVEQYSFI